MGGRQSKNRGPKGNAVPADQDPDALVANLDKELAAIDADTLVDDEEAHAVKAVAAIGKASSVAEQAKALLSVDGDEEHVVINPDEVEELEAELAILEADDVDKAAEDMVVAAAMQANTASATAAAAAADVAAAAAAQADAAAAAVEAAVADAAAAGEDAAVAGVAIIGTQVPKAELAGLGAPALA